MKSEVFIFVSWESVRLVNCLITHNRTVTVNVSESQETVRDVDQYVCMFTCFNIISLLSGEETLPMCKMSTWHFSSCFRRLSASYTRKMIRRYRSADLLIHYSRLRTDRRDGEKNNVLITSLQPWNLHDKQQETTLTHDYVSWWC